MSNPFVRVLGTVKDIDGARLQVGVDYTCVTVGGWRLDSAAAEEFMRLFSAACEQVEELDAAESRYSDEPEPAEDGVHGGDMPESPL